MHDPSPNTGPKEKALKERVDECAASPEPHLSQEAFSSFVENFPGIAFIKDQCGRYTFVNQAGAKIYHRDRTDWLGKTDDELWPVEQAAQFRKNDRRALTCGRLSQFLESVSRGDSRDYWLVNKFPVPGPSGDPSMVGGIAVNVTEQKRIEEELRRSLEESRQREREVSALIEGLRAVLTNRDFKEAARAIFDPCKDLIGARAGYICMVDEETGSVGALFVDRGEGACGGDPCLSKPVSSLFRKSPGNQGVVYFNDLTPGEVAEYLSPGHESIGSLLWAPMIIDGKTVGALGLAAKPGGFTEQDARLAEAFAKFAAIALVNNRAEARLRESKETLEEQVAERTRELVELNEQLKEENRERRHAQEAVRHERDKVVSILKTVPDCICIIGAGYTMDYINPAMERELGAAGGRKCYEYLQGRTEVCPWCRNESVFAGHVHRWVWTSARSRKTYQIIETPLLNVDGALSILKVFHDITEDKQKEKALKQSEQQLRSLSSKLLTTQEDERKRIALELHDSIGSSLSAIKFGLENTLWQAQEGNVPFESIRALIALTQSTIEESRRMMMDLRPSVLDDLGIVATIGWFCRQFRAVYSDIQVREEVAVKEKDIRSELKIVIFRVIQEAFHNVTKHSRANRLGLTLAKKGRMIELSIEDNGVGFDMSRVLLDGGRVEGLGLAGMKERAQLSGGSFSVSAAPGKGTLVRASWPFRRSRRGDPGH